ncbi:MAG: hypothetical protein KY429_09475 [Actinobacteria bacterium]|nr:hypothetical protein [Actinomycetota bacterium]
MPNLSEDGREVVLVVRRRLLALAAAVFLLIALPSALAGAAPSGTFSGSASALAFELSLKAFNPSNPQGFSAGVSAVEANHFPFAKAKGAGTCEALGPAESLMTLPCQSGNTEQVEVTGSGEQNPEPNPLKCETPAVPAAITAVLNLGLACGNAHARITGDDPFADGRGNAGTFELVVIPQQLLDLVPDQLENLLPDTPKVLDAKIGSTVSRFTSEGSVVTSRADASPSVIVVGGVAQGDDGQPDGLLIIETGDAFARASWNGATPIASGEAKLSLLTIRVRQLDGSYETVESPSPGQSTTQLSGTALQTTITAASSSATQETVAPKGSATAKATAVQVYLAQGVGGSPGTGCGATNCDGGVELRLAIADAHIEGEVPVLVPQLPTTGGSDRLALAGVLAMLGAWFLVQRLNDQRGPEAVSVNSTPSR